MLERKTVPSALLPRRILGSIRPTPIKLEIGRTCFQAETALRVLDPRPGGRFDFIKMVEAVGSDFALHRSL